VPAQIAAVVCVLLILWLLYVEWDRKNPTSVFLWIPIVWLALAGSRSASEWLNLRPPDPGAEQYMEGDPLNRLVYSGLLAVGLIVIAVRWRRVGKLLGTNIAVLLFLLYCVLSVAWSDYPDVAFKRWTKALGDLVMVLIVLSDREPFVAVKRLLARTSYFLIPLSVLFVKYYPDLGRMYGRWDYKVIYTGVTTNKNTLGVICLVYGLASLWRLLTAWNSPKDFSRGRQLIAHSIILAMVMWLFVITNSMTSLSCFLMGSVLLFAANIRAVVKRPVILHLLIAAELSASASVLFLGASPDVLRAMGRDPTLTDRTDIWGLVISLVDNPIVGTGFESFWLGPRLATVWQSYRWGPTQAHNGYLEIYLQLGWLGVLLLAIIIATGYRTVISAVRRRLPTASLMLVYFFVGMTYNFTEAAFFRMMASVWILLLLAITRLPKEFAPKFRRSRTRIQDGRTATPCDSPARGTVVATEAACPAFK
jgi:exopolysaccharide production protein ExoQ